MRFLVDVDSTVADMCPEWLRFYNEDYDDSLTPEDITKWAIHEFVKPECGTKIYDYLWMDGLYAFVEPIDGALSAIQWLRRRRHEVVYVTSGIQPAKIFWLHDHKFLEGGTDWRYANDVVIAHNKKLIPGDYMIDDNPKNLDDFVGKHMLFDQPWNQDSIYPSFHSWSEIVAWLSHENHI